MSEPKEGTIAKLLTTLGIISIFVTLTETVLGLALTQVTGGVQVALTVFVIFFALAVAGGFFTILWNRPYVFYSPSEYGDKDPAQYAKAMKSDSPDELDAKKKLVENAEQHPNDKIAQFKLINTLLEEPVRQFLILMHEKSLGLPVLPEFNGIPWEMINKRSIQSGSGFSGTELSKKIGGTGLRRVDGSIVVDEIKVTPCS